MKVLVKLCGGLGDELCLTPIYREIKRRRPDDVITAYVKYRELLLHNPDVDHLLKYGRHEANYYDYDRVYNIQWQSGKFKQHSNMHLVDFFAMQVNIDQMPDRSLCLNLKTHDFKTWAEEDIPKDRPIITFDAYANKPANRWGSKYFREVIHYLKEKHNAFIIQTGTTSYGIDHVDLNLTSEKTKHDIGIRDMAAVIAKSDLFIGNNSGASHIASAVKTPSVKIFGCTLPYLYLHSLEYEHPVHLNIPCQGCQNKKPDENPIHNPKNFSCPDNKQYRCLTEIYPFIVQRSCDQMLEKFYYKGIRNWDKPI